jgi:hypothetical protein
MTPYVEKEGNPENYNYFLYSVILYEIQNRKDHFSVYVHRHESESFFHFDDEEPVKVINSSSFKDVYGGEQCVRLASMLVYVRISHLKNPIPYEILDAPEHIKQAELIKEKKNHLFFKLFFYDPEKENNLYPLHDFFHSFSLPSSSLVADLYSSLTQILKTKHMKMMKIVRMVKKDGNLILSDDVLENEEIEKELKLKNEFEEEGKKKWEERKKEGKIEQSINRATLEEYVLFRFIERNGNEYILNEKYGFLNYLLVVCQNQELGGTSKSKEEDGEGGEEKEQSLPRPILRRSLSQEVMIQFSFRNKDLLTV